jgi:2-hydroxy-3-oxopropionate reductase
MGRTPTRKIQNRHPLEGGRFPGGNRNKVAKVADIGFVGLGIMGFPMASQLQAHGHQLYISPASKRADEMLQAGAVGCGSLKEIAERAEITILMVPDTPQVEAALFGPDGLAEGLSPDKLVIDMSSISPLATKGFAQKLTDKGVSYLDAPVSGGEVGAKSATLSIMVGGTDAAFERARPLFELLGKSITHVGANGAGQTAKVANQIIVALNIAAVGEALIFASRAGADPAKVREALLGGFASSRVLEVHGQRMLERTFAPGFRIGLHRKDLNLALASGNELGLPLPQTAFCQQLLNAADAAGEAELDHSAIVRSLERLAGHEIG